MRRVKIFALLSVLSTVALVFALVGRSGAGPQFDVINGTATAGAVHIAAGNDAFPNFATGAVDNRYPLANAHVDNLSSQGYGSPADTGPIGQTGAATAKVQQPQYASAKYPPSASSDTVGKPPVAYATVHAAQNTASADSAVANISTSAAPARAASIGRLNSGLRRWRSEFLTADDKARYPFASGDANEPDGAQGLTTLTTTSFDPNAGVLSVDSDARIAHASFGGGTILLDNVHLDASITNDGTPTPKISINVGGASVGGVPVTIGTGGVSVDGTSVPGTSGLLDQANAALNQTLTSAGFQIAAVSPIVTKGQNMTSIDATALRVHWQGGNVAPGVPGSFVETDLGEVFAFSLAVPSTALPALGPTNVGGATNTGPTSRFIPGTPGTPGTPGSSSAGSEGTSAQALAPARKAAANKPLWLLLLYFAWQSSIIGAAAALWLWRAEPA